MVRDKQSVMDGGGLVTEASLLRETKAREDKRKESGGKY